jgi:hypothetical protein
MAPIVLRTERLPLRPFQDSDVEDALSYRDDPKFAQFLPHIWICNWTCLVGARARDRGCACNVEEYNSSLPGGT